MKLTITFIALLSVSTTWGIKVNRKPEDPKDKREAAVSYPTQGHATQNFQAPALGHDETNAISIGAGYSVGGAKPSYSFGGRESGAYQFAQEGQTPSAHASIQLAPITLQPGQGSLVGTDLAQLMNQLSQSLNSGAYSLQPQNGGQAQYIVGTPEVHQGAGQDFSLAQFGQLQQGQLQHGQLQQGQFQLGQLQHGQLKQAEYITPNIPSPPSYAAGTKGLSSFSSTGPVLFSPASSQQGQPQQLQNYAASNGGHNFGEGLKEVSGHSFPSFPSFSGSGQSPAGYSFGSSGHSSASYPLGAGPYTPHGGLKTLQSSYLVPGKSQFKPSAFIGSAGSPNAIHGLPGFSGSYAGPSFSGSHKYSGFSHGPSSHGPSSHGPSSHGPSFGGSFGGGSSKVLNPFGSTKIEGYGSFEGSGASISSNGHFSAPPGTTYGIPTGHSFGSSSASHAASSISPTYYMTSSKHGPSSHSFGEGSQSFRGPGSSHGALSSYSSGHRYSGPSARFSPSPKDIQGSYSDNVYTYNTIKYSEELKPKVN